MKAVSRPLLNGREFISAMGGNDDAEVSAAEE